MAVIYCNNLFFVLLSGCILWFVQSFLRTANITIQGRTNQRLIWYLGNFTHPRSITYIPSKRFRIDTYTHCFFVRPINFPSVSETVRHAYQFVIVYCSNIVQGQLE
jgi:hypothetical protein